MLIIKLLWNIRNETCNNAELDTYQGNNLKQMANHTKTSEKKLLPDLSFMLIF